MSRARQGTAFEELSKWRRELRSLRFVDNLCACSSAG
jgi:hypothetical protein